MLGTRDNTLFCNMFECKDISESTLNRVSSSVIEEVRIFINNLQRRSSTEAELEIRLGRYENGRFISNIEEKSWQRLLESLESQQARSSLFAKVKDWTEIVDWFFTINCDDSKVQMRSSRTVENDTMVRRHLIKKKISESVVGIIGDSQITNAARVSFATEEDVTNNTNYQLPSLVTTDSVRIKHRKTFQTAMWKVDMTKAWAGTHYSAVTKMRDGEEKNTCATFEVEIECLDTLRYFNLKHHSNNYIAASCLMKILGLLPPGSKIE